MKKLDGSFHGGQALDLHNLLAYSCGFLEKIDSTCQESNKQRGFENNLVEMDPKSEVGYFCIMLL